MWVLSLQTVGWSNFLSGQRSAQESPLQTLLPHMMGHVGHLPVAFMYRLRFSRCCHSGAC
jgi:hypothetical protein